MVALLKCPNCGAPLQGVNLAGQHACTYCGALLQVPKAAPPPAPPLRMPTPAAAPRAPRAVLVVSIVMLLGIALAAGVTTFRALTASMSPPLVAAPVPAAAAPRAVGATAAPQPPVGIPWSRLEAIDIHATTDQAKVALRQQFPEAKVEQDKDYRLDLDHPILSDVFYSWNWGCTCLERVVFFFKDYPTRMKTQEAFIPCLVRGLGPLTTSAPPFDYDWAANGDMPRVHLGPQTLTISIEHSTSEATYRKVLRVLGGCRN